MFACVPCLSECHTVLKNNNNKKMSLRILPKCWCVCIVMMLRNEYGDGIAVDTGSNIIYGKNIVCMCGEL